jgi:Fe-S-cluster containining protein
MSVAIAPRFNFPDAEKKYKWLSMLLDGYHILDRANKVGIDKEEKKRGQKIACGKGCFHCCLNPTVPITAIELAGISWFACEQLTGDTREKVKSQLLAHEETAACPFLVEHVCSIYPVRPIACRAFHVFGEQCTPGEDPWLTRRNNTWSHGKETALKVSMKILPYWDIKNPKQQKKAFEFGFIMNNSKNMHEYDWTQIYNTMLLFD